MSNKFNLDNQLLGEGEEFIAYDYYDMPTAGPDNGTQSIGLKPGVNPNLVFDNIDWIAEKVIFTGRLHQISNADYDGTPYEMIIVHKSIVNSNKKLALCIPLDDVGDDTPALRNVIHDLYQDITTSTNTNKHEINTIMNESKVIYYKKTLVSGDDATFGQNGDKLTVLVMANPVQFYLDSQASISTTTGIFAPINPSSNQIDYAYSVIPAGSVKKISPENIYIDCKPTGESKETIATYNVPINSEYTANASRLSFQEMVIQSMLFFALLGISYLIVPIGFKSFGFQKKVDSIINAIQVNDADKEFPNGADDEIIKNTFEAEITANSALVYLGILGIVGLFVPLFTIGTSLNDPTMTSTALYIAMFVVLSIFSIYIQFQNKDYRTVQTSDKDGTKQIYEMFYFRSNETHSTKFDAAVGLGEYFSKGASIYRDTLTTIIMDAFVEFKPFAIIAIGIFVTIYPILNSETLPGTGENPLYLYKNAKNDADKSGVGIYFGFLLWSLIGGSYSLLKHAGIA